MGRCLGGIVETEDWRDDSLCLLCLLALEPALAVERPDEGLSLAAQRLPVIKDRPEDDPHILHRKTREENRERNSDPRGKF